MKRSLALLLCACDASSSAPLDATPDGGGVGTDGAIPETCAPGADEDRDDITNQIEGCTLVPARDSDGDHVPDWRDSDSDGDGVEDGVEDRNHDGVIGRCTQGCADSSSCTVPYTCRHAEDGQGVCVAWECLDGETDPRAADTDGDGLPDGQEATQICSPMTESNPAGLKPVRIVDSQTTFSSSVPNWRIALEVAALDGTVAVTDPAPLESAYIFDLPDPGQAIAGFLATRPAESGESDAVTASQAALARIGGTLRASGTRGTSLDGYDTVLGTTLAVTSIGQVTGLRREVLAALLDRTESELTVPPLGWTGATTDRFVVIFQTEYRADAGQVLFMGALAAMSDFDNPEKATGFHAGDLSNGTGLARSGASITVECEQFQVNRAPTADIIWVLDQSGSMDDDRDNVEMNAMSFFERAVTAGLDFRMGVTDMNDARQGIFATREAGASTGDRWLSPSELASFTSAVDDPSGPSAADAVHEHGLTQGSAAVSRHLPRDDNDPAKIRGDARLVLIYVTDEHADEIEDDGILPNDNVSATPERRAEVAAFVQPYVDQLLATDAIAHVIGVPESDPGCSGGSSEVAYGYMDLVTATGGQFGSICQTDFGPTLDAIIDDVVGAASPIVLGYVPISATIAVARDGVALPRSRTMGWDYRASSNSIVFNGMPFDPLNPSEIVVSYRRWEEQID